MKLDLPDIDRFERNVFKRKDPLNFLLAFSLKLLPARHIGLLLGTNKTQFKFIPPDKWDRGVIHKFSGKGIEGLFLKYFGAHIVKHKGVSPIKLYNETPLGEKKPSDGIISYALRNHNEFYKKGVKILIVASISDTKPRGDESNLTVSPLTYDGQCFKPLPDLKINTTIVKQFNAKNIVSAYIPDYGAIVFNTLTEELLKQNDGKFAHEAQLKKRCNMLIAAIEMASIANIGLARGRQAAHMISRKEKNLRKTASQLNKKAAQLNAQKEYLRAVGAVNEKQLNMEPVNIFDGVYAFMDMVGSASLRKKFNPRDYFYILNLCHQIAADNANRYSCRVDNFMGDAVLLESVSPFDDEKAKLSVGTQERVMLMVFCVSSIFNEIVLLKTGRHKLDKEGCVKQLIERAGVDISFRAGIESGPAMIGPLGSQKRKIVTAIGEAVITASRLESSGVPERIHIKNTLVPLLKEAYITRDTRIIQQIVFADPQLRKHQNSRSLSFLECYKIIFGISQNVIKERKDASYKEFSEPYSYFI